MPDDRFSRSSIAIFVWDLSAVQPFLSGLKRRKLATDRKSGIKVQRDRKQERIDLALHGFIGFRFLG
jgi:hypothetical protein